MDILLEWILVLVLLLIVIALFITMFITLLLYKVHRLPAITPRKYLKKLKGEADIHNKTPVICIGDSITHGRISTNYLKILRKNLGNNFEFINAGLNSHLAWNVLERLNEIIECNPAIITILIGTNDVNAKISNKNEKDYIKRMKLPRQPDHQWFCQTLKEIIKRLKEETDAHIAILTLPTIGENINGRFFDLINQYNTSIIEIALEMNIKLLPLHRTMIDYLKINPGHPKYEYEKDRMYIVFSVIQHYFLHRSWDQIAANAGFKLHRDYLHLNTEGATMIANLIEEYTRSIIK